MSDQETVDSYTEKPKAEEKSPNELFKKWTYRPTGNEVWNPLMHFPRNQKCFCGSVVKFKKCCLEKMPRTIPREKLKEIQEKLAIIKKARGIK